MTLFRKFISNLILTMSANPNLKLNILSSSGAPLFYINQTTGSVNTTVHSFTNTSLSTNSTTSSVIFYGGVSIANSADVSSNSVGGSMTICGGLAIGKSMFVNRISAGIISTPGISV